MNTRSKPFKVVDGVCSECGMAGSHYSHTDCIDALRSMLGDLELAMVGLTYKLNVTLGTKSRMPEFHCGPSSSETQQQIYLL